jgi:hypothetical protein
MDKTVVITALFILSLPAHADEWTSSRPIASLRVDGRTTDTTVYFETQTSWAAAGCPTAKFVFVRNNSALKEILAVGLAAKASGSTVRFVGNCQDSDHFQATYIILE